MELNTVQIMDILPHRPPFLLVDRITDYEPGVWARGYKCVALDEPFFAGHFPGRPILPGVLILEALAQTVLELSCTLVEQRGGVGFGKAEARVAGKLACQAELTFAVG